ncbi:MAG: TerB family tellurite resistance protein [Hydrogenophaga sp.]|nr:TerB family tellurite resistance protein [Hydrogenophaga sp.]
MKAYSVNSPEAAARVLAMAMLADGHCSMTEIRSLDRQNAPERLGLSPQTFRTVIDGFCEDLMVSCGGQWSGTVDPAIRKQLMAEITDRELQDLILMQSETLMLADGHLADGEVELLDELAAAWRRPVLL